MSGTTPPSTLNDILARFAPLIMEPEPVRGVRGPAMALGMDWLLRLPEGKLKDQAIETLGLAADLAVESLVGG